jgi:hypothetical protein
MKNFGEKRKWFVKSRARLSNLRNPYFSVFFINNFLFALKLLSLWVDDPTHLR